MKIIIGNLLFISALFLIIARFLSVFSGTPFPVDLVTSDSMSPALMEGDIVAWTPTKIKDIEIGDVIVFKSYISWPDEKIVVHRVSDIKKSSSGAIFLETKGDNNEWTDQRGPHLPEPYVREKNFLGKTISIGQQPLKIPFVGIIGLWINEGFNAISEPTTSKESINYLGVFAPLTISAVILVVLVFIIPEKAKTIKEKLNLNIFGRTPLNLKRTILMFLIAYIIFFTIIHSFAFDSISGSVGINSECPESQIEFGRMIEDRESLPKKFPLINPSTMPVKGIIFGNQEIGPYVQKQIFELDRGDEGITNLYAFIPKNSTNGSYTGNIMMYSSPFWLLFPDDFINFFLEWNAEATVVILDLFSALILTFITVMMLVSITFIGDRLTILIIDRSWRQPSRLIIRKNIRNKFSNVKNKIKTSFKKNISWVLNENLSFKKSREKVFSSIGKPALASMVIIPIIYIINDQMSAILLSVLLAGILAYFISCKLRKKIILTALITITLSAIYLIVDSNLLIFQKNVEIVELLSLSFGVIGLYILIFTFLMVPLIVIIWIIVRYMRNLKEQKDPLLAVEGRCDL